MYKPSSNVKPIEILTQPEQRRRRSVEQKLAIGRETFEPGVTVSGVGRRHQVECKPGFRLSKALSGRRPISSQSRRSGGAGIRPGRSDEADS
jgi:hypothetical protein